MPFTVHEFGGIAVPWSDADAKDVERELRKLDPALFLDKEYEPNGPRGGYVYYVVKHNIGSGHPPIPCVEWRDDTGPFPLSMALVEKVRRRENALTEKTVWDAVKANEAKKQKVRDTIHAQQDDILKDHVRMSRSKLYPMFDRNDLRKAG